MDDQAQRRGPDWVEAFIKIVVGGTLLYHLAVPMVIGSGLWLLFMWGDYLENEADTPPRPPDTSEYERTDPGPPWEELAAEPVFDLHVPGVEAGEVSGETGIEHLYRDRSMPSRAERVWQVNDIAVGDEAYVDALVGLLDHDASFNRMVCDEASLRASGIVPVDLPTRPRVGAMVEWATFTLTHEPEAGRITLLLAASYRRPPYPEVYGEEADGHTVSDDCPTGAVQAAGL